jgi:hypothetical protein
LFATEYRRRSSANTAGFIRRNSSSGVDPDLEAPRAFGRSSVLSLYASTIAGWM